MQKDQQRTMLKTLAQLMSPATRHMLDKLPIRHGVCDVCGIYATDGIELRANARLQNNKKRSFTAFVFLVSPATCFSRRALPYVLVIETMEYTSNYKLI
jgi:hypothetical protein